MNFELLKMRELNHRISDRIHVRLLWCENGGQLAVSVTDARNGAAFAVDVRDEENALDVFHHPYAYAAWHGVDTLAVPGVEEPEISLAV